MGKIQFFEEMFEPRLCTFLLDNARSSLAKTSEFTRSNFHWSEGIRKSSAAVLVRDMEAPLSSLVLEKLAERGIIKHQNYQVMNYAWTRLSYIPWHEDAHVQDAVTIYLNDKWDLDWGGLFLYQDGKGRILGYAPAFNCGLRNQANVAHSTTPVTLDAPEPRFLSSCFQSVAKADPQSLRALGLSSPRRILWSGRAGPCCRLAK